MAANHPTGPVPIPSEMAEKGRTPVLCQEAPDDEVAPKAAVQDDLMLTVGEAVFALASFFAFDLDWTVAASYRKCGIICSVNTFM